MKAKKIDTIKMFDVKIGNSKSRTSEQMIYAQEKINSFLEENKQQLLIFTDGSVKKTKSSVLANAVGNGGCGGIIVNPIGKDIVFNKPVGRMVDNVESEVAGIVEGIKEAVNMLEDHKHLNVEKCTIICDCEAAIEIVGNQKGVHKWIKYLNNVWKSKEELEKRGIKLYLAWTPGHCGIKYNDTADIQAKKGSSKNAEEDTCSLSLQSSLKQLNRFAMEEWQQRWGTVETGYATKELIPRVGTHVMWPSRRSEGVSFTRALLDNAAVNDTLFQMKFADSPNCDCQEACRETVKHKILHCQLFQRERERLEEKCAAIWEKCKKFGNLSFNLKLFLNPGDLLEADLAKEIHICFSAFLSEPGIRL